MDIGKFVGRIINLAMLLAAAGLLYQATLEVKSMALDTARHGMVSLGDFNRRLERGQ
jgi:hypothetical protein